MRSIILCFALFAKLACGSIIATGSISFTSAVQSYTGATLSNASSIALVPATGSITTALGTFAGLVPLFPAVTAVATIPASFSAPLPVVSNFLRWADNTTSNRFAFDVLTSSVGHVSPNDL